MDVHWMQRFLGLLQCDAQPPSSIAPLKTNRPLSPDDPDGDDDLRSEFACPFCYEQFDIGSLCSHIDEQHCFESQSAVCPVCAAKVGEDVVGHITLQHGHFFKRRRRLAKANASSSSALYSIGKEPREASLQAHLGRSTYRSAANSSHAGKDPLLSRLVYSLQIPETQDVSKPTAASEEASSTSSSSMDQQSTSLGRPLNAEQYEQKLEEAALQAKFAQQLVLSTIFWDD